MIRKVILAMGMVAILAVGVPAGAGGTTRDVKNAKELGAVSRTQDQAADRAIRQLAADYHASGRFDGVVVVARNGRVISQSAVGMANRERGLPNALDTPYRLCSITKQFTALLVMQQVQTGRLRLEGVVTDYLPDFRQDTGNRITLRNLLRIPPVWRNWTTRFRHRRAYPASTGGPIRSLPMRATLSRLTCKAT